MRHRLQESLAPLASEKYQQRFVVHATKDEYVLPEEMLDSASGLIENILSNSILSRTFNQVELDCLRGVSVVFLQQLKTIPLNNAPSSAADIITKNEGWSAVQAAAKLCLQTLGFDLHAWEKENA